MLVAVSVCLLTPKSFADFMEAGPPQEGGSLSFTFTNTSGLSFSAIIVQSIDGSHFAGPGLSDLSTPTWETANFFVTTIALGTIATPWTNGLVTIHFEGSMLDVPTSFAIFGIDSSSNTLADGTRVDWDGSSFSYSDADPGDLPSNWEEMMAGAMMPLPSPVWLGSLGLVAIIVWRRKIL